jgi:glutamine amidotransferase
MCRWLACTGTTEVGLFDLLYNAKHSIILQSLHSTMGAEATNGDGFGVGWYNGNMAQPALYRSVEPAWHDLNIKDISKHITAHTIFAHVRAASPGIGSVQQTNCHPFRYENWLWMHNGAIRNFSTVKRDLMYRIDSKLFPFLAGSTDSEVFFFLALTFGLEDDPPTAVAKAAGYITEIGKKNGAEFPLQMTVAATNGRQLWAFRFSSEGKSRTLFYSSDKATLMNTYAESKEIIGRLAMFGDDSHLIVSEPLGDLPGVWNKVPESSCVIVDGPSIKVEPFEPIFPDM